MDRANPLVLLTCCHVGRHGLTSDRNICFWRRCCKATRNRTSEWRMEVP